MMPLDKIMGLDKPKVIYSDLDGQIYTASDGGYDILVPGGPEHDARYARLLKKLEQITKKKIKKKK